MFSIKFCLGVLLGAISFWGLLLNIAVLFAVLLIVIRHQKSPIFIISASNLFIDSLQLILAVGYLVPSIILDEWIFPGGRSDPIVVFLGSTFLMLWYNGSVTQILMAINRLVVVCMPHIRLFTTRNVSILVTIIYPLSIILTWISQYVSPCCQFSFDHTVLSYSYTSLNDTQNYSNSYIDLPLNTLSSSICASCYAYIIYNVRMQRQVVDVALTDAGRHKRRMKEYTYALQFCAISGFYLFSWVAFRVFPEVIGSNGVEYFILVSLNVSLNSMANAVVYASTNAEVRSILCCRCQRIDDFLSQKSRYKRNTNAYSTQKNITSEN